LIPAVTLVDEDDRARLSYTEFLEKSGLVKEIYTYDRPGSLLADLRMEIPRPSVLFIELHMPGMNAFEFLSLFMKKGYWTSHPDLQIYLLSRGLSPEEEEIAEHHPMLKRVLPKPLTPDMIRSIQRDFWLSELVDFV